MHSLLLERYVAELKKKAVDKPVLDLACGSGRNGLYLLKQGIPVVFADVRQAALDDIKSEIEAHPASYDRSLVTYWCVDFESDAFAGFDVGAYAAILVFRYLHRPLMRHIEYAIEEHGLIFYETFTTQQAMLGRPKNPDFLLSDNELPSYFNGWKIHYHFEGLKKSDTGDNEQAIAQLVAVKNLSL